MSKQKTGFEKEALNKVYDEIVQMNLSDGAVSITSDFEEQEICIEVSDGSLLYTEALRKIVAITEEEVLGFYFGSHGRKFYIY